MVFDGYREQPDGNTDDDQRRPVDLGGLGDGPLRGRDELVVHSPVLPLQLAHAPPREGIAFELLQPFLLSRSSKVHPELQDQGSILGKWPLEVGDPIELLIERSETCFTFAGQWSDQSVTWR